MHRILFLKKWNNWECFLHFLKTKSSFSSVKNSVITKCRGEEVKKSFFFPGSFLSPSAYCLVNQLTCCQRSLCECALAEGQSDPPACLSQGGKWRPWYAISGRNVQTVWLPRQAWLAVALPKTMLEELPAWLTARGTRSTRAGGYSSIYSLTPCVHGHFQKLPQILTTLSSELHRYMG